jgi:2-C-methyl-D-erythritol 4-phosphate cytidylyltransferase
VTPDQVRGRVWALVPAAGSGRRFGGEVPKQYLRAAGKPLIEHALEALLSHPGIGGAVVSLAADDPHWPGWTTLHCKPLITCIGGGERADSVFAALRALPLDVADDELLLVHDAARPNLHADDITKLIAAATACADGAILAAPVRDTLKREEAGPRIASTESRDGLWRAMTPQAFRRGLLLRALERTKADGVVATDEAMAVERIGLHPALVEGREDNLKVTTPADLALAEYLLSKKRMEAIL